MTFERSACLPASYTLAVSRKMSRKNKIPSAEASNLTPPQNGRTDGVSSFSRRGSSVEIKILRRAARRLYELPE